MKWSNLATRSCIGLTMTGILLAVSACVSGPPENASPVGPARLGVYPLAGINKIILELPAGATSIVRGSSGQLSVALEIACASGDDSCREFAGNVVLEDDRSEGQLTVGPNTKSRFAYRNAQTDYRVEVPDNIPLQVKFGYGELIIRNVVTSLKISMSAGAVEVDIPETAVRHIWLNANFGDATLLSASTRHEGQRRLLVGAEVDWKEGTGEHDLSIDVGAGDITVRLTD